MNAQRERRGERQRETERCMHLLINDLVQRALIVTVRVSSSVSNAHDILVGVFNLAMFTELRRTETALRHYDQHLSHRALYKFSTSSQCLHHQPLLKVYTAAIAH